MPHLLISPVFIALLAIALGTVMDAVIKIQTAYHAIVMIAFIRYLIGTILSIATIVCMKRPLPAWPTTRFHALRGLVHVLAAVLFFYSVKFLALAEATSIGFTATLLAAPLAWLFLNERFSKLSLLAAGIGFVGVLVIAYGQNAQLKGQISDIQHSELQLLGVILGLISAAAYALSLIMLRARATQDHAVDIALLSNGFPALYLLPVAVFTGGWPNMSETPPLVLIGLTGTLIWVLMTFAYARAPARRLAPLEYSALVWSAGLGYILFGDIPDLWLWLGASIIIAACFCVMWEDLRTRHPDPFDDP